MGVVVSSCIKKSVMFLSLVPEEARSSQRACQGDETGIGPIGETLSRYVLKEAEKFVIAVISSMLGA